MKKENKEKIISEEQFAKEIFSRDEEIYKLECEIMGLKECEHKFVYSFREQNADYKGNYHYKDVVICEKCGLIKRY